MFHGAGLARIVAARKARVLGSLPEAARPTDDPARSVHRPNAITPPQLFTKTVLVLSPPPCWAHFLKRPAPRTTPPGRSIGRTESPRPNIFQKKRNLLSARRCGSVPEPRIDSPRVAFENLYQIFG